MLAGIDEDLVPGLDAISDLLAGGKRLRPAFCYWGWRGGAHVWIGGHWIAERPGWRWVPDRWEQRGDHWHYWKGHWER